MLLVHRGSKVVAYEVRLMRFIEWSQLSLEGEGGGEKTVGYSAVAEEKIGQELKPPSKYQVILINDDYTPMDFVVEILEMFFRMSRERATQVMLTVHTVGSAVCGVYTRDVAETRAEQVNRYSQKYQ